MDRGTPRKEVVQSFSISLTTLKRRLKMKRGGKKDLSPGTSTGRKRRILATLEEKRTLWKQLEENDDATLEHHCQMWEEKTGARLYMRKVLVPRLKTGQIVIMDNLSVHRSAWVRDLIEDKGCRLWLLPSYSPYFNPIEEAFSKVKALLRKAKARTLKTLFEVTEGALRAVSKEDASGFFEHCGYKILQDHLL